MNAAWRGQAKNLSLAFFALAALACLGARSAGETPAAGQGGVVTAAPTTFALPIPAELRSRLEAKFAARELDVVRLTLRDLRKHPTRALKGVRVFLDLPSATLETPVESPHFAGAFSLGLQDQETILLNIAPTLAKIWRPAELAAKTNLQVTLVPETWDEGAKLPADFAMPLAALELDLP